MRILFVYDFDFPDEWTPRFHEIVKPLAMRIADEVACQREWDRLGSDVRMSRPGPASPATDEVLGKISEDFSRNCFRAFHATRLPRPQVVLNEGLRALKPREQLERVQRIYRDFPGCPQAALRLEALAAWTEDADDGEIDFREGQCWLVPSRTLLHDDGLTCMFDRHGGEFIQRNFDDFFGGISWNGAEPGRATVVVARIPSCWCRQATESGPRKILGETLKSLGQPLRHGLASYWDVNVPKDIPPANIEFVCDRQDTRVAVPPSSGGAADQHSP